MNKKVFRLLLTLLFSVVFASACSSSGSDDTGSGNTASPNATDVMDTDGGNTIADDGNGNTQGTATDGEAGTDAQGTDNTNEDTSTDTSTAGTTNDTDSIPDPLIQNATRVTFDITVPSFESDALQVKMVWGDINFTADWLGDQLWVAEEEFPTNTSNTLVVTFADQNGALTLASFESNYTTGTNVAESFTISANQFSTEQWDDDNDGISNIDEATTTQEPTNPPRVLLFSETQDFRHDSTETALLALEELAASAGMQTERAPDSTDVFTTTGLANYAAVVWVMTSGDVLNDEEQIAFENYIRAGGGYAGIHAASFTEYEWPWYGSLVGAYFDTHPDIQSATQNVEDQSHESTAHLDATWTRTDEWYDYQTNPRANVNVLLSLDESTYTGGVMGEDHPSAWYHEFDGGRSWYTGGGHTHESYAEDDFRAHLLGGLQYVVGR